MRETANHAATRRFLAAAPMTPPLDTIAICHDPVGEHRPAGLEPFAGHLQTKLIELAERCRIGVREARKVSVGHVEIFRMDSVRTSNLGRSRRLPRNRYTITRYALNCDEPDWLIPVHARA